MLKLATIVRISVLTFAVSFISGCQTQLEKLDETFTKLTTPPVDVHKGSNKNGVEQIATFEPKVASIEYKQFKQINLKRNVKLAVQNNPEFKAQAFKTDMSVTGIRIAESGKNVQATSTILAGAKSEDQMTEPSALATISVGKILFDYGASDFSVEAQKEVVKSSRFAEAAVVDNIAVNAIEAWINVARNEQIEKIFERGIDLATPLLGQIKNISVSGVSDKAGLLAAKQKFANLEISFEQVKATSKASRAIFSSFFHLDEPPEVQTISQVDFGNLGDLDNVSFKNSPDLKANESLIRRKQLELNSVKAASMPRISLAGNATVPAENLRDDTIANFGLDISYNFSDGGLKEAQIENLKYEIDSLYETRKGLSLKKKSELVVRFQEYFAAKKKISSANELLNLAVEVRETAKGQLISGRSSIQDVMNAEVTLAETEIGLVNAKADAAILSYKIFALTDSLSTYIGWFE